MAERKRVAIVEDDFIVAEYLREVCERLIGHEVVAVAHGAASARDLLRETRPDWVLMDVRLGDGDDGVDVALDYISVAPDARIIYVTGSSEPSTRERILTDHPYKIIIKPIMPADLRAAFE